MPRLIAVPGPLIGAVLLAAFYAIGFALTPAIIREGATLLWPAACIAALLLRAGGLASALSFTVTVAAARGATIGFDGLTLILGLHPLLLDLLLRHRVPLAAGQAAIGVIAGLVDAAWLIFERGAVWGSATVYDIVLCGLFGWGVGSVAAALEAGVGPIRRAAVQRYGMLPPVRRLADVCGGVIALPLAMFLAVAADDMPASWQTEARITTLLAAARADDALASWWNSEVAGYRTVAQRLLDRHYGYYGLPTAANDEGSPQWLRPNGVIASYVVTRDGDVLIRSAPDLFVEAQEIKRTLSAIMTARSAVLLEGDRPDTVQMLIPIRRDNDLLGLVAARYPVSAILQRLPPLALAHDTVSLYRTADVNAAPLQLDALPSPSLLKHVALLFPPGTHTAARLAAGETSVSVITRLPNGWGLRLDRPLFDIVSGGVVGSAWILASAAIVIFLFELTGRMLVQAFIGRLAAFPNLQRGWSRRESLADDLAQNLRQRHHELGLKAAEDSQALARHQAMLASAPLALFTLREQGGGRLAPSYLSPGMQTIARRTLADIASAADWESLVEGDLSLTRAPTAGAQYAAAGQSRERTIRWPDGTQRRLHEEISILSTDREPFECVGVWLDIEERKQAEEKLRRGGHLMALGEMATSMAHELNQPLNAMRLALENLAKRLRNAELADDTRRFVDERIERLASQAERASGIVDRFRVFGRKAGSEFETSLSVSGAIKVATETLVAQLHDDGIVLEVSGVLDKFMVVGPPGALEQILVNLIGNARDAILDRRVREKAKPAHDAVTITLASSATHVEIVMQDTGGGIAAGAMEHLFEPFFTTKPIGKGTGLGLSISYGLAISMRGDLRAWNTGGGAKFSVSLPLADAGSSQAAPGKDV